MTRKPVTPSLSPIEVRMISSAETLPLRSVVLRPGRPLEAARFPGDDAAGTAHFGAFRDGKLLSIASLFPAELPEKTGLTAFQLRGMATDEQARNQGLGRALVLACLEHARAQQAKLLWCNARIVALDFYRKLGFATIGPEFDIPDVGPHFRMWRNSQ
jgi:GNAT superfamily N-acetyltransferase